MVCCYCHARQQELLPPPDVEQRRQRYCVIAHLAVFDAAGRTGRGSRLLRGFVWAIEYDGSS